jgi:hypothetical protein
VADLAAFHQVLIDVRLAVGDAHPADGAVARGRPDPLAGVEPTPRLAVAQLAPRGGVLGLAGGPVLADEVLLVDQAEDLDRGPVPRGHGAVRPRRADGEDRMEHEPLLAVLRAADRPQPGDPEVAVGEGQEAGVFDQQIIPRGSEPCPYEAAMSGLDGLGGGLRPVEQVVGRLDVVGQVEELRDRYTGPGGHGFGDGLDAPCAATVVHLGPGEMDLGPASWLGGVEIGVDFGTGSIRQWSEHETSGCESRGDYIHDTAF